MTISGRTLGFRSLFYIYRRLRACTHCQPITLAKNEVLANRQKKEEKLSLLQYPKPGSKYSDKVANSRGYIDNADPAGQV
jgi:hypothetical protein